MNTKMIRLPDIPDGMSVLPLQLRKIEPMLLLIILMLLWFLMPGWLHRIDETAGNISQDIWMLLLLSMISFILILALCWWLLKRLWAEAGLPTFNQMVLQFKTLPTWQQLGFYWGSFALLLLTALGCLSAIF